MSFCEKLYVYTVYCWGDADASRINLIMRKKSYVIDFIRIKNGGFEFALSLRIIGILDNAKLSKWLLRLGKWSIFV